MGKMIGAFIIVGALVGGGWFAASSWPREAPVAVEAQVWVPEKQADETF